MIIIIMIIINYYYQLSIINHTSIQPSFPYSLPTLFLFHSYSLPSP